MRFKIEKLFNEDGKISASAKGLSSPMNISIFEIPSEIREGDIVEASPIKRGGGCAIFYKFESLEK